MNVDDYESLPTNNIVAHMTAGALAGVMEHCIMYPLDSVKTRMQSLASSQIPNKTIGDTFLRMVRTEGVLRPVRGMSAVIAGAGPAHALYFSCYEFLKDIMVQKVHNSRYNTLIYGISGCMATVIHDAVMNPAEVVKQRVQMYNSPYKSVLDCFRKVYKTEGIIAFYRSYTTQLTMNIPFQSIHFMSYEFMQSLLNTDGNYNPKAHMISGAFAGGIASAITTPLDVCKTLLNTQEVKTNVVGLSQAIRTVYRLGGPSGYFKGMQARVLYTMPATAICWSTYEFFKYMLGATRQDESHHHSRTPDNVDNVTIIYSPSGRLADFPSEKLAIKPRELPSMSGAGLYGAISLNTVHSNDTSSTCTALHKGNSLLDITRT